MTASTARAPSAYLPDVEGLRGIAILLVVAYHAGLSVVPGGYVGVDVFFVLSGYLIVGQLARELETTGRIDLPAFYARRARRLLPAAAVVILATLLASLWLLPSRAMEGAAAAGIAAALYVSNLFFAQRATDYLADETANPLLHTWSLSVEEQFYVVWPLALALFAMVAPRLAARKRVLWLTGTFVSVSFVWAVIQQPLDASWAFLSPLTRAWEFGIGGMVAITVSRGAPVRRVTIVAGYLGAAGILGAAALFGFSTSMPSWPALLPTVGTALVLWGAREYTHAGVSRWLSAAWLCWVGRASYSWYLWHWPAGVLTQYYLQRESLVIRIAAALASLALAEVTRRWIENPVRFHPVLMSQPRYTLRVAALVIMATGLAAVATGPWVIAGESEKGSRIAQARERPRIYHNGCFLDVEEVESPPCVSGDTTAERAVVLFGDSHAAQWYPALQRLARERQWRLISLTKASCPIAWTPGNWSRRRENTCMEWRESAIRRILETRPFLVVASSYVGDLRFAANDSARYEASAWREGLRRSLRMLDSGGINTVVIHDTPRPGFDVPACVETLERRHRSNPPFCVFERTTPKSEGARQLLVEAARGLERVTLVDVNEKICPEATCRPLRDGMLVWRDRHHLAPAFSRYISGDLARGLEPTISRLPALASR